VARTYTFAASFEPLKTTQSNPGSSAETRTVIGTIINPEGLACFYVAPVADSATGGSTLGVQLNKAALVSGVTHPILMEKYNEALNKEITRLAITNEVVGAGLSAAGMALSLLPWFVAPLPTAAVQLGALTLGAAAITANGTSDKNAEIAKISSRPIFYFSVLPWVLPIALTGAKVGAESRTLESLRGNGAFRESVSDDSSETAFGRKFYLKDETFHGILASIHKNKNNINAQFDCPASVVKVTE
jgi:hypothetical protein